MWVCTVWAWTAHRFRVSPLPSFALTTIINSLVKPASSLRVSFRAFNFGCRGIREREEMARDELTPGHPWAVAGRSCRDLLSTKPNDYCATTNPL